MNNDASRAQTAGADDSVLRRPVSRRQFLQAATAVATAAVTLKATILSTPAMAALPEGVNVMSEADYAVFNHMMQVMFTAPNSPLVPFDQLPVMATLDGALLATMPPHILAGLKGGVGYFNDGPKEKYGKPFSELSQKEAAEFIAEWSDAAEPPKRALTMGIKKLVGLAYWAIPPTWEPLGYPGPVSDAWGLKPLGNSPLPK